MNGAKPSAKWRADPSPPESIERFLLEGPANPRFAGPLFYAAQPLPFFSFA